MGLLPPYRTFRATVTEGRLSKGFIALLNPIKIMTAQTEGVRAGLNDDF